MNLWVGEIFDRGLLVEVRDEIVAAVGDPRWKRFDNAHEAKLEGSDPSMWGPATRAYYAELQAWLGELEQLLGLSSTEVDTYGGGWHAIPPGGFLDRHVDFNAHPDGRHRRANVLTYLNERWDDPGGYLELGEHGERQVAPELGVTVAFETDETSWHGHPKPAVRWRFSIAAYLYDSTAVDVEHSTVWA